jgi:hypothetical protein
MNETSSRRWYRSKVAEMRYEMAAPPEPRRWARRALLRAAALAPLAACAPARAPTPAPAAAPTAAPAPSPAAPTLTSPLDVVRQGDLTSIVPGAAIAQARGYFRDLGIDNQHQVFASGAEQTPLLATGQLDVGTSSSQAGLYNAVIRGVQQRWVVDNGHLEAGVPSALVALRQDVLPADGTLPLTAIQGRAIATPTPMKQGGLSFPIVKMLATVGLTVDDVDWQTLPFASMTEALTNRAVDGAIIIEPFFTLASQRVSLVPWQNLADYYPGQQSGGARVQRAVSGRAPRRGAALAAGPAARHSRPQRLDARGPAGGRHGGDPGRVHAAAAGGCHPRALDPGEPGWLLESGLDRR